MGHWTMTAIINIKERVRHREFAWALGQRIKQMRAQRKIEQVDFAKALCISQSAISRLETGASDLSVWQLSCLAEVLKVPAKDLIPPR